MATVEDMLANHQANSWSELTDEDAVYDDPRASDLERLEAYIDHCFETYPILDQHLTRSRVQGCVADWDRRRGLHKNNAWMSRQVFGKRVSDTKYRRHDPGCHAVFVAKALIGIPPEEDKGRGWKKVVEHELGHAVDAERRGHSDHSAAFKDVMEHFGDRDDGMSQHGYAPSHFK